MFVFFDDELKSAETKSAAPGRVQFDERGNAVYIWRDGRMVQDGALQLAEDQPATTNSVWNDRGLQAGYNPYQSGLLAGKKPVAKNTNIRELSKWIETKRRLGGQQLVATTKK
jgi:hypothetical protein